MRTIIALLIVTCATLALAGAALAADGVLVRTPELLVVRHGGNFSVSLPGTAYKDFKVEGNTASLTIEGAKLGSGARRVQGKGVSHVSWEPAEGGTKVLLELSAPPAYTAVNAVDGTEIRPGVPQVLIGLGFDAAALNERRGSYPVAGSYEAGATPTREDTHGTYELPKLPPAKYSDALVTLKVRNVDFRDVLWLMSQIGNVSIMLDPYWNQEPTGTRRPPGGGAGRGGGGNGGSGSGGPGFRGGGIFVPNEPREGTGDLSLSFENVPFDEALDLVLMAVGLVKVDIYPGDMS